MLAAESIGTGVYYPRAVYDYECYRHHPQVATEPMPVCEEAARRVLSLPVHPMVTASGTDRIVSAVDKALHA